MYKPSLGTSLRRGAGLTVTGFFLTASVNVFAQSAIEEVVVTAQRTEQSLQEVPIAVTAFSGAMMEDKQILSPSDLQLNAPNVSFTATNFGGSSFSIRGIGRLVIAGSGENGVSIHQNQIAVPTNLPAAEFYDLERVEILRGPQGTLFGRNATGGAVNMVTKMPDFESWNGFVDAEAGDYSNKRLKGALNMPITDNFAVRVAGMWLERDGYITNTAAGQTGDCLIPGSTQDDPRTQPCQIAGINDSVDGRDITTFRITGLWEINDRASAWVQYSRFKEDDDKVRITNQVCERSDLPTVGCKPDGFGFDNPHAGSTTGGIFGGLNGALLLGDPTPASAFNAPSTGFRKMHTDFNPIYKYNEDLFTAGFDYDFDNYRVGLLAGYQQSDYVSQQDYLMDVGFNLYATAANPAGLWPTSAPPSREAGSDWTSPVCNFQNGTSGIFGGCVHPSDQTRVFAYDSATSDSRYWTVEAKLESAYDGPFNFIIGSNYTEYEGYGDYYVIANTLDLVGNYGVPLLGFPPLYPTMFNSTSNPSGRSGDTGDSVSVFGEVYYDFTDTVRFTAGLRYNRDKKSVEDTGILFNAISADAVGLGLQAATVPGAAIGVPEVESFTLTELGLLDPNAVANTSAAASEGGIHWTRALNILLGPLATDAQAIANERTLAGLYGVTDAQLEAAAATPAYSAERFAISSAVPIAPGFGESRALTGSPSDAKFTEFTGRLGVDWQMNDNTMVYAFFTRGYKPGGFNPPLNESFIQSTTAKYIFDPEEVDAFEIGAKNVFLDGSLVLNTALFLYDYKGLQTTRIANNTSINDNIDANIWGAELELFYRPEAIPGLSIDASYSYLKAEVDGTASVDPINRTAGNPDYILLNNIDPGALTGVNYVANLSQVLAPGVIDGAYAACGALSAANPNPACPQVAPGTNYANGVPAYFSRDYLTRQGVETNDGFETNLDGNSLPNAPEHTIHLGLAYTWQVAPIAGSLTARWDYYWQDSSYAREFNTPGDKIDAWDQHNASLIYESNDGLWSARAWVRNVQNEDNVTGKYLTADTSGFFRNYFLTEPRIYGVSVRYSFDGARR
ncbi:MAG: TonB-dependent receptor [Pseudomonadales bacterium]